MARTTCAPPREPLQAAIDGPDKVTVAERRENGGTSERPHKASTQAKAKTPPTQYVPERDDSKKRSTYRESDSVCNVLPQRADGGVMNLPITKH